MTDNKMRKPVRDVTIADVAEKCGVSIATVSRVLNRKGRYSVETQRRVEAAAREIGYAPNHMAKSLKRKRTEQIALAISDIGNPVYVAMAKSIQQVVKDHGYRLILLSTEALVHEEIGILKSMAGTWSSSLSPPLACEEHRKWISALAARGCHLWHSRETDVDSVLVDSVHPPGNGAPSIPRLQPWRFINGPSQTVPGRARLNGYYSALVEHNLPIDEGLIIDGGDFTLSDGYMTASRLLEISPRPEAVICANDLMALGVMRYLGEKGLRVPRDMAVVGMDDIEHASLAVPPLTTVSLLAAERGRMAAELLMERLEGGSDAPPKQVKVLPKLVVRESSVVVETVTGGA